jgi:hypothetical protein
MSRVLSFRLDDDKPDEAQALALIDAWTAQGHDLRKIMTTAILALADKSNNEALAGELRAALADVQRLAETIQRAPVGHPIIDNMTTHADDKAPVSDELLAAVARNARKSRRLE